MNEFSRTFSTETILKTSSGKRRQTREFKTTITATEEECHALEMRFELDKLYSLKADLSISCCNVLGGSRSKGLVTVDVQGTINASLNRTCVRTNKEFVESFDCKFDSIVKPTSNGFFRMEDDDAWNSSKFNKKKQKLKSAQLSNLEDLLELQDSLDASEGAREDIIEDEHIYSLSTGLLDVGELVAQNFWLGLDPYPKLPGSEPVEMSISG